AMKRSPTFTIRCTPLCCALSNLRSRRQRGATSRSASAAKSPATRAMPRCFSGSGCGSCRCRRATSRGSSSASATSTWSPRAGASAPSWTNPTRSRWLCCSTISTRRSGQQSGWAEPQRCGREFGGSVDQPPDLYPVAGIGQTALFGFIRAALDRFFGCHSGRDLDVFSGGDLDLEFVVAHFAMPDFRWHGSISSRGLRSHPANTGGWSFDRGLLLQLGHAAAMRRYGARRAAGGDVILCVPTYNPYVMAQAFSPGRNNVLHSQRPPFPR